MKNDIQKNIEELKNVSLSKRERGILYAKLEAYADFHPATAVVTERHAVRIFGIPFNTHLLYGALSLVLVASLGVGTSFAATGALPGTLLYAVKININEPLVSALAKSPESRAQRAAELATLRIEEASTLASAQKLTPEAIVQIQANLTQQVAVAATESRALEAAGRDDAALAAWSDLETRLVAQGHVMHLVSGDRNATSNREIAGLVDTIDTITQSVGESRMRVEATVAVGPPAHVLRETRTALKNAKHDIESASRKSSTATSTSILVQTQMSITAGENALAEAQASSDAVNVAHAYKLSQHARRVAHETALFMQITQASQSLPLQPKSGDDQKNQASASSTDSGIHIRSNKLKEQGDVDWNGTAEQNGDTTKK